MCEGGGRGGRSLAYCFRSFQEAIDGGHKCEHHQDYDSNHILREGEREGGGE